MKYSLKPLSVAAAIGAVTMLILIGGLVTGAALFSATVSRSAQAAPLSQVQPAAADPDLVAAYEQALIGVYRETLPSVVNIQVTKKVDVRQLGFNIPGLPDEAEPGDPHEFFNQGGGTGFVWDDQGHIVTNYHVVSGATEIEVIFADDTVVTAQLIGSDPDSDLAVIKVDAPSSSLRPIKLGDSDNLEVGQLAIAIGNPFGQDFTMTSGIVSGVGRVIRGGNAGFSIPEVVQTDAPINPGNSGGPLLNRQGEVLGINSQIISQTGSNSGIGFAVPINIAKQVIPALIRGETFQYAWLGISGGSVTAEVIEARNLPKDTKGAVVAAVIEDGPAEAAGLQGLNGADNEALRIGGEIITAIDGQPIKDMNELITYLVKETQPDDTVTLDIIQADGQSAQVKVTLGVRPAAD